MCHIQITRYFLIFRSLIFFAVPFMFRFNAIFPFHVGILLKQIQDKLRLFKAIYHTVHCKHAHTEIYMNSHLVHRKNEYLSETRETILPRFDKHFKLH